MEYPALVLLGVNMLFVAFILLIIAENLRGVVGAKEVAAFCILVGSLNTASAAFNGFVLQDPVTMGAQLLFGFTYLFFAQNILRGADTGTGLGVYCLCVLVTCIPFIVYSFIGGTPILAIFWILWAQLWGLFWVANGLKKNITKFLTINTYCVAILNGLGGFAYMFEWINI